LEYGLKKSDMLTIKIEDTYVEYPDDVDIPMVLRSPLLNEGKGSYIFNFTLPATDAIKKVLDYYHRPGRHGDIKVSKKVAVEFGPLKYYGKAEISEADDDSYEISCPINSGDLSSLLKEATLKGLDLGGDRNILNTTVKISAKSPDEYTYSSYGPDPFEEIVPIAFTVIEENIPAGSMAADGRSATIADVGDAFINLDFKCEVILGIILFRLYADGVLTETVVLESNTKKLITLQNWSGVLTWDLLVQNGNAQEPGMFELDATVFSGSTISIRLNGMLGAYTEMYPNMDFVLFPFENPSMLANIPDDTYAADNFQMKDVYAKFFPVLN
jgi:hypothetical protein